MCIGTNTENDKSAFDNLFFENSEEEVLLGIADDNKLTFNSHIKNICFKKGQKLGELLRITNYLNSSQKSYIWCDYKISVQLFPFNLDVLLKKSL